MCLYFSPRRRPDPFPPPGPFLSRTPPGGGGPAQPAAGSQPASLFSSSGTNLPPPNSCQWSMGEGCQPAAFPSQQPSRPPEAGPLPPPGGRSERTPPPAGSSSPRGGGVYPNGKSTKDLPICTRRLGLTLLRRFACPKSWPPLCTHRFGRSALLSRSVQINELPRGKKHRPNYRAL